MESEPALLDWLDAGRDEDVRAHLAEPPGTDGLRALLRRFLGIGSDDAAENAAHAHSDPDIERATRVLRHLLAAGDAVRSGRIEALVRETCAARDAVTDRPWLQFRVGSYLQAAYRFTGDPRLRTDALEMCGRVADRADRPWLAVPARALMGNIHMLNGAFHRALDLCDAALDLARATGTEAPAAAMAHQFRAYVLFEWNRLEEAEAGLLRAWDLAPASHGVRSGVARMMARLRTAAGDEAGADLWLQRLTTVVSEPMTLRNREWLASVRMRQTLGPGQLRAVEDWLRAYEYRPSAIAAMRDADIHARLHELDQVLALLEATEQWTSILAIAPRILGATRTERPWFAARAASAHAVALEAMGNGAADDVFRDALALGEGGSFVRVYLEGSRARIRLLEAAARERSVRARAVLGTIAPDAPLLTPAQLAVLQLVAAGASNKTIARDLDVSVSTVKTHLRAIFARLDVSSRTQAVAHARAEGILPV